MDYTGIIEIATHSSNFLLLSAFVLAFAESLAFVGLLTPGTVAIGLLGALASHSQIEITKLMAITALGAFLGDFASFYLGKFADKIFRGGKLQKLPQNSYVKRAEEFFYNYGGVSVFLGRFIGPIRPIIPFVAGMLKMKTATFIWWDLTSAVAWSVSVLATGYFFGEAIKVLVSQSLKAVILFGFILLFIFIIFLVDRIILKTRGFYSELYRLTKVAFRAVLADEKVQKLLSKYPKLVTFFKNRFKKDLYGLYLTVTVLSVSYLTFLFVKIYTGLKSGIVSDNDLRILNLVSIFQNFQLAKWFYWITILGEWKFIILLFPVLFWVLRKKIHLFISAFTGFVLVGLSVTTLKNIIQRPRPELAMIPETSFAFPSGHAAFSTFFYGFIIYLIFKLLKKRWRTKINFAFVISILIVAIGFSRVYLGVHFASDIVAGTVLRIEILIITIYTSKYLESKLKFEFYPKLNGQYLILSFVFIPAVLFFSFEAMKYSEIKIPYIQITQNEKLLINALPEQLKYSETIFGVPQEPMNFIILANSDKDLIKAFERAGWSLADKADTRSLMKALYSLLTQNQYPNAPMTPSFWNKQVHDFGFQKQLPNEGVKARHHARFWKTPYTLDGKRVYFGTASLDKEIKWLITHKIDPDIDTEREYIFSDLQNANVIASYEKINLVKPTLGKNFAGDPFFTDGQSYVLELTILTDK